MPSEKRESSFNFHFQLYVFSWHKEKKSLLSPEKIVFSLSTSYIWCNWECCLRLVHLLVYTQKPPHRLLFSQRPYFILLYSMHKTVLCVFLLLFLIFGFLWAERTSDAHACLSFCLPVTKTMLIYPKAPISQSLCSSFTTRLLQIEEKKKEVKV